MDTERFKGPPTADDSLVEAGLRVLLQPDPWKKAEYTYAVSSLWQQGEITCVANDNCKGLEAPDRPARSDDTVKLLPPGHAPKRGRGGSLASRQAILHSLVHIENWAVDLAWDAVVRFGLQQVHYRLPKGFFDDFVRVAEDECRHFSLLAERLKAVGSWYGAFTAHDGLWDSARATAHCLPARLAVEHCVHEARGLDVLPATIGRFRNNGDEASASLLETVVYPEEISHCAAGVRWISYLFDLAHRNGGADVSGGLEDDTDKSDEDAPGGARDKSDGHAGIGDALADLSLAESSGRSAVEAPAAGATSTPSELFDWVADARQFETVESWFHALTRRHFYGPLKPPFNDDARAKAGFGPEWYVPLAAPAAAREPALQASEVQA